MESVGSRSFPLLSPLIVLSVIYPAYDFAAYERELNCIHNATSRGDHWGAKREMGLFLRTPASHAGIIYPGSEPQP
ncbi:MAG TPA: hypothetical protein VJ746_01720 [Nitrospira sp.]|nr:hypothetical protein [Nitrospira sp.]